MAGPDLCVVMPVYNEGPAIERVLRGLEAAVATSHEVLVVYDFDEDTTIGPVAALAEELPGIRLHRNTRGPGVLNAMRAGIEAATAPFVLITMADGSDDHTIVDRMVEHARRGAALVAATRYSLGGRQIGGPRLKGLMSRAAGLSLRWIGRVPVHDATNSFKLYRRDFLESVAIESTGGFELALELTVKAHRAGLPMAEVPTTWRDRSEGESRFDLRRWLPLYLRWYGEGLRVGLVRAAQSVRPGARAWERARPTASQAPDG